MRFKDTIKNVVKRSIKKQQMTLNIYLNDRPLSVEDNTVSE